jgi:O-Antigen ligase
MLKKIEYICVVGSIALIGADRIDFLWGQGFFKLTPFLFFATLVVLIHILFMGLRGSLQFQVPPSVRRQVPFLLLFALFLLLSFTSTIFGVDPQRGLVALSGLVLVSILGFCISVRVLVDPAPEKLVVRSITFALVVWLIFCVGECISWSQGAYRAQEEAASSIASMFAPTSTLLWLPRLSGYCLDANRAAFILVMYLVLLDRFVIRSGYSRFLRFAVTFFLLLTVSRSGMLCWLGYSAFSAGLWKRVTRRVVFKAITAGLLCLALAFIYWDQVSALLEAWQVSDMVSARFSGEEGSSTANHVELIERGLETWSQSPHTMIAGIGFAASPRFLGDFFDDNKYGNFHSLYVSVLAELGLPAFLLFMVVLCYPLLGRRGGASCIAAIMMFNAALQSYMEPIFWVAIALMWALEVKGRGVGILAADPISTTSASWQRSS